MAKLYFYYSAMNAGKSAALIQAAYNYKERGMNVLVVIPKVATSKNGGQVISRTQLKLPAWVWSPDEAIQTPLLTKETRWSCVMVDEAQFLSKQQVDQLCQVVDELRIPVLAYGLRTNFMGELFDGSHHLLALADHLEEIKTMCFCGKKALMTARFQPDGQRLHQGQEIVIGGNEQYLALCRFHHRSDIDFDTAAGKSQALPQSQTQE
jgi:thymidine kinase